MRLAMGGPDYDALLSYLCTSRTVSYNIVSILEGVDCLHRTLVGPVLHIYTKLHDKATVLKAFNQVWSALTEFCTKSLRESLSPYIVNSITNYTPKKRAELYERLQCNKPWDGTEVDLIDFARGFPRTSWLWPALDPDIRDSILFLMNNPDLELIKPLGVLRIYIQNTSSQNDLSLISQIDAYCKSLLFPHCDIEPGSRGLVNALMRVWHQSTDGARRDLALRIARYPGAEKQISCQRISQIMGVEKEVFSAVLDVLQALEKRR